MAYIINKYNGEQLLVLEDGTLNDDYGVGLLGKNTIGYGEVQNENFVRLLENFAGTNPPSGRVLTGQLYYNTDRKQINVYDGAQWKVLGDAIVNNEDPTKPIDQNILEKTIQSFYEKKISKVATRDDAQAQVIDVKEAPIYDRNSLLKKFDNDQELIDDLIRLFLKETPPRIETLKKAIEEGDVTTTEREAHTIKSSSDNVGAMRLRKVSAKLETEARDKKTDSFKNHFEEIVRQFTNYEEAARKLL